ncbi:MAG: 50S ribosomal protein L9 [Candidatus Neomarinimicrobiota bacterium]
MSRQFCEDVILLQDVQKLGSQGDVVRVKPGYARNYLLPQGLAKEANARNLRLLELEKQQEEVRQQKTEEEAKEMAEKLKGISLTAPVQVGEEDRVFGSVTSITISKLLKEQGHDIDKKDVLLQEPIKALGLFSVPVRVHGDIQAEVKVYVIKE